MIHRKEGRFKFLEAFMTVVRRVLSQIHYDGRIK